MHRHERDPCVRVGHEIPADACECSFTPVQNADKHGPDSCNSTFGNTNPRTCETDLQSLDVSDTASVPRSGAITGSTGFADSIPFREQPQSTAQSRMAWCVGWKESLVICLLTCRSMTWTSGSRSKISCFMHSRSCHMSFVVYGACAGNTSEAPKKFPKQAFGSLQGEQVIFSFVYELIVTFGK